MVALLNTFQQILNAIIPILVSLGVVYFIWGVVQYVIADGEEAKKKGKDIMIYGIIGLTVIIGMWGFVNIVVGTFFKSSDLIAPSILPTTGTSASCDLTGAKLELKDYLCYITRIINNSIIPIIFGLAITVFVWGVVQFFIFNAGDAEKRSKGKQFMIGGIIALAVMVSVWGLVRILGGTFGLNTSVIPQVKAPASR